MSPIASASEGVDPSGSPSAGVSPSASDGSLGPTATPRPHRTAPPATPKPTPVRLPPSGHAYLIITAGELTRRPTSGSAYSNLKAVARETASPDLCDQNDQSDVVALANGLLFARTGQASYRTQAIDLITKAMPTQRVGCSNAVLALGRQLGGYVMAADLVGYRDGSFISWLRAIRTKDIGGSGRWHALRGTSQDSANNWGLWATASLIAADAYLGDSSALAKDWAVFKGYGDGSWPFQKTSDWSADWSCRSGSGSRLPIAIDPQGCTLAGGFNGDGAPVEDASRSSFPSASSYIHEALDGMVISALILGRRGYAAWSVNDAQICRVASFAYRVGRLNDFGGSRFAAWVTDAYCATDVPRQSPTTGGRMLGFTDWLYG
ncbi:MAG TPA: hypothetical protein VFW92_04915 [Candidatus Limnocylindrales bacterium]|nr:hypothetical protein [Candidatus Limnocylindrales bacterium]